MTEDLYHSAETPLERGSIKPFLHLGTRDQALMRRPKGILYKITLKTSCRVVTMKDTGSWEKQRLQQAAKRAPIARYLNRYEGIAIEDLDNAAKYADDPDSIFAKKVPSAGYSWIVLDPSAIAGMEIVKE